MAAEQGFHPILVVVGDLDPAVAIRLKQMDGVNRVAFSCQAAEVAAAIDRGEEQAGAYGFSALAAIPVEAVAAARARRFCIELIEALVWAWDGVAGASDEDIAPGGLWDGSRASIAALVRFGDADLGVPPLVGVLGGWFNGPLLRIEAEGERFGPSLNGDGAAGPSIAKAAAP